MFSPGCAWIGKGNFGKALAWHGIWVVGMAWIVEGGRVLGLGLGGALAFHGLFGIVEVAQVAVTNEGGQLCALRNMLDSSWRIINAWSYIVLKTWNCGGKSRLAGSLIKKKKERKETETGTMSASRTRLTRGAIPGTVDVVQKPGGSVSWVCDPRCGRGLAARHGKGGFSFRARPN